MSSSSSSSQEHLKQQYAEELRRHTLRQWTIARDSLEQAQGKPKASKSPSPESASKRSGSRTRSNGASGQQPFRRIREWFQ